MPTGLGTLDDALAYENEAVVRKFIERYDVALDEARDLFQEVKRWLWLQACAQRDAAGGLRPPALAIDGPLRMLDEMWHTFILFTREYAAYCQEHFGSFIHHAPTTHQEIERHRRELARAPLRVRRREAARMRAQYRYVHDRLGEATLLKWYSDYAQRYGAAGPGGRRTVQPDPGGPSAPPGGRGRGLARRSPSRKTQKPERTRLPLHVRETGGA